MKRALLILLMVAPLQAAEKVTYKGVTFDRLAPDKNKLKLHQVGVLEKGHYEVTEIINELEVHLHVDKTDTTFCLSHFYTGNLVTGNAFSEFKFPVQVLTTKTCKAPGGGKMTIYVLDALSDKDIKAFKVKSKPVKAKQDEETAARAAKAERENAMVEKAEREKKAIEAKERLVRANNRYLAILARGKRIEENKASLRLFNARTSLRKGFREKARHQLFTLVQKFPDSEAAREAKKLLKKLEE